MSRWWSSMELISHGLFEIWSSFSNRQPSLLTRRIHPSSALPICWSLYTRAGLGPNVLPENVKDYRFHCPTLEGKGTGESGRGDVRRRGGRGEEREREGRRGREGSWWAEVYLTLLFMEFFSFLVLCFLSLSFCDSNTLCPFCVFSKIKPQGLDLRLPKVTINNEINEEICFLTHHERLKSTNI